MQLQKGSIKDSGFPEVLVSAFLPKSSGHTEPLEMPEEESASRLIIPPDVKVTGFFLEVEIPGHGLDVVIACKDVAKNGGAYHLKEITEVEPGHVWRTTTPIEIWIDQSTGLKYTPWHRLLSNRINIFVIRPGEEVFLLQAGVVVRGEKGHETFHLLVEQLWRGHIILNQATGLWTGIPVDPSWGSFESRRPIFDHASFRRALLRQSGDLVPRVVEDNEINPPLGLPKEGCYRPNWWIPFMGQRGQGGAVDSTGKFVYLAGNEILGQVDLQDLVRKKVPTNHIKLIEPDDDGIIRLPRGKDVRSLGAMSSPNPKRRETGPKYPQGIYWA